MAQKGWVIWVATAVMPWCMLGWTERLRAQEGRTLVPSGPTPPAGTTRYDAAKALADALVKGLSLLDSLAIRLSYDRWLSDHEAEIARAMPERGGVLVWVQIAHQANTGEDMYGHRFFLSAFVAKSGQTEAEAQKW